MKITSMLKKVIYFKREDLELDLKEVKAKTEVVNQFLPPKKTAGRILDGELEERVNDLINILRNEVKSSKFS